MLIGRSMQAESSGLLHKTALLKSVIHLRSERLVWCVLNRRFFPRCRELSSQQGDEHRRTLAMTGNAELVEDALLA